MFNVALSLIYPFQAERLLLNVKKFSRILFWSCLILLVDIFILDLFIMGSRFFESKTPFLEAAPSVQVLRFLSDLFCVLALDPLEDYTTVHCDLLVFRMCRLCKVELQHHWRVCNGIFLLVERRSLRRCVLLHETSENRRLREKVYLLLLVHVIPLLFMYR